MREWLKKLRKDRGWRQLDVAEKLDVSIQQYNFIENGKRQEDMNLSTASKLADLFNIPLSTVRMHEEQLAALRAGKDCDVNHLIDHPDDEFRPTVDRY